MKRYALLAIAAAVAIMVSAPVMAQNINRNSNTNTNNNSNSTDVGVSVSASNGGVNFNGGGNPNQPGGLAIPSPSAGYCGGLSGGFGVGFAGATFGASIGTIEKACAQDRHIGVGMSDAVTRPEAEKLWFSMNKDLFGDDSGKSSTTTSSLPVAVSDQVAEIDAPVCVDSWPMVTKLQHGCK